MSVDWFKLHNDIIHDPKIRALAFEDRWHFVALMVLMNDGTLAEPPSIRDELVEVCLGLHGVDLENLKKRLCRLRLISDDWKPLNWDRRQQPKDKTAAERMRKYRESLNKRKGNDDVTRNVTEQLRTEEEVEEEKEKNVANAPFVPIAETMWERIQPITKQKKPKLDSWANDLRLLHERDGRSLEDIQAVFIWANGDDFWRTNILSAGKLRKQFPTLFAQYQKSKPTSDWRRQLGVV